MKTRVRSFKLTKYDLVTADLATVDRKRDLPVFVLDQKGYDSEAFMSFPVSPKFHLRSFLRKAGGAKHRMSKLKLAISFDFFCLGVQDRPTSK